MKRVLVQSALWLAVTAAGYSQAITGEILGTVADATGASVAQAKVTVRNLQTNIKNETRTSNEGSFRVLQLPIGAFEVTVEKEGFAKYVASQVQLALNQRAELRISLQVASTRDAITVVTESPIINTTNAEISTNFEGKRISELPLSTNRNILNLAASVPGVSVISAIICACRSVGKPGCGWVVMIVGFSTRFDETRTLQRKSSSFGFSLTTCTPISSRWLIAASGAASSVPPSGFKTSSLGATPPPRR